MADYQLSVNLKSPEQRIDELKAVVSEILFFTKRLMRPAAPNSYQSELDYQFVFDSLQRRLEEV